MQNSRNKLANVSAGSIKDRDSSIDIAEIKMELDEEKYDPEQKRIEKWKEEILYVIRDQKNKNDRTDSLSFSHENFPAKQIGLYLKLQEEIAELLPLESSRPTLTLYIKGRNQSKAGNTPDMGLLGGVGPLSDAHIVTQLIEKEIREGHSIDDLNVVLLSSPPPRKTEISSFFRGHYKYYTQGYGYLNHLSAFGALHCSYYAILSNSMHLHSATLLNKLDLKASKFINLVEKIADKAKEDHPNKVLVLGTLEAAEGALYPTLLNTPKNKELAVLPNKAQQVKLQKFINLIKSGKSASIGPEFIEFLESIFRETKPSHVILSCTEIPLLLKCKSAQAGQTYFQLLNDKISENNIKFIDSEDEMINILSKQLEMISQTSSLRGLGNNNSIPMRAF